MRTAENIVVTFKNNVLLCIYRVGRYGCQLHDLLAAKLNACVLETSSARLVFNYLTNRKHQIKTDVHYSS